MKILLVLCSLGFLLYTVSYIVYFFISIIKRSIKKQPINLKSLTPLFCLRQMCKNKKSSIIATSCVIIIGAFGLYMLIFHSSTEIGSFWEKSSYDARYEAYISDKNLSRDIFCIATVNKSEGWYYISDIELPHSVHIYLDDCDYDPDSNDSTFTIYKEWDDVKFEHEFSIQIGNPVDEDSFKRLHQEIIAANGEFCSIIDKSENLFHYTGCPKLYGDSHLPVVYFETFEEAFLFNLYPCTTCIRYEKIEPYEY